MQHALGSPHASLIALLLLASPPAAAAQTPDSHAVSGEFKQPTPAPRFRQMDTRDNLVHPPGYRTAPLGTFGEVVERGQGSTPVILIAGLGPGWRVFESLIEAGAGGARFLAVTLAGYGGSSAPPMPATGASFAEGNWLAGSRQALGRLIEERALERPILVAFYSDAARIAVRYALRHPERVGGLLVISASARFSLPPGADRGASLDGFAQGWFKTVTEIMWPSGMWPADAYCNDRALSEKTWWDVLQPSVPTAVRYTVETWADDLVPDLAGLETPTLVLSPGFDEAYLATSTGGTIRERFHGGWGAALEAGAGFEHIVVEGARLLLWEDRPEVVLGALEELVERRAAGAPGD